MGIILLMGISIVCGNNCGGNCPSNSCQTCYCGNEKSIVDIDTWCSKYSWDKGCCKCIVASLSGGNANAMIHHENGSSDVGLWQINNIHWGVCSNGKAPCDPSKNLNCAILVYKQNQNSWKEWADVARKCGC